MAAGKLTVTRPASEKTWEAVKRCQAWAVATAIRVRRRTTDLRSRTTTAKRRSEEREKIMETIRDTGRMHWRWEGDNFFFSFFHFWPTTYRERYTDLLFFVLLRGLIFLCFSVSLSSDDNLFNLDDPEALLIPRAFVPKTTMLSRLEFFTLSTLWPEVSLSFTRAAFFTRSGLPFYLRADTTGPNILSFFVDNYTGRTRYRLSFSLFSSRPLILSYRLRRPAVGILHAVARVSSLSQGTSIF